MDTVQIDPIDHPTWERLVAQSNSSVFHSARWLRVLHLTYGLPICAHVLLDEDHAPVAGLPYSPVKDLKGTRLVTLPFSDYCDPLVGSMEHWHCLLDRLLQEDTSVLMRCVHNLLPLQDQRLHAYNRAKWHGMDLHADLETVWQKIDGAARRAIRKAQQSGVTIHVAQSKTDLRHFYEMHLAVRKNKYRLLAQPYRFFECIWDEFVETGQGRLLIARQHNRAIGGTLFLRWQDTLFYKFNASTPDTLVARPNDLLIWEGIVWGKQLGCTYLDFGLSDWDQEGLIRYKRKFATDEKTISFLRSSTCATPTDQEQQVRRLLPQLTELLTDRSVPDAVTERAGEVLYRLFV